MEKTWDRANALVCLRDRRKARALECSRRGGGRRAREGSPWGEGKEGVCVMMGTSGFIWTEGKPLAPGEY